MNCSIVHKKTDVSKNQKKTSIVILITVTMMFVEIFAGLKYGSIALLSDGIHMGTHTFALLITLIAYIVAQKNSNNTNFTFGTGKVGILGGYTSAVTLLIAALYMIFEAVSRFISPIKIDFDQSLWVAVIGLVVNTVSALLLKDSHDHHHHSHDHGHSHSHEHQHSHHHEDHNLKAAYLHVIADALTSVLAIIALLSGKYFNAIWLDPAVGIVGAIVIIKWGLGLLKSTGTILLDYEDNKDLEKTIIEKINEENSREVLDLHIWQISNNERAIICTVKDKTNSREEIYNLINELGKFCHITVELR